MTASSWRDADPPTSEYSNSVKPRSRSSSRPSQNIAMASRTSWAPWKKRVSIELGFEEDVFELLHRVARVLGLDAVVPGEEGNFQPGQPGSLDLQQAVFQLLPETRRGPVLDGEAGPFGDLSSSLP